MPTSRRGFIQTTLAQAAAGVSFANTAKSQTPSDGEWRNKQPGMAYRRLGRTGLMISELVSGGDPITSANYQHLNLAIEMGLNYLDMAPAYSNGDCEIAYGKLLGGSSKRDKVFLQTKVSAFLTLRYRMYGDIFKGLPADKQTTITARAEELHRNNLAEKPGYYLDYFPGQRNQFPPAYLATAMMPDYAHLVEGSQEFRKCIADSIDGSLKRVGTDHFDLLMCPHGASIPEELDNPHIYETFQEIRRQGKVRFLGVTSHNDAAGTLRKATALGH